MTDQGDEMDETTELLRALTPRRRYLLRAAWEGRVYRSRDGRYWLGGLSFRRARAGLDSKSDVTVEFVPLLRRGLVLEPRRDGAEWRRVVGFSYAAQRSLAVSS